MSLNSSSLITTEKSNAPLKPGSVPAVSAESESDQVYHIHEEEKIQFCILNEWQDAKKGRAVRVYQCPVCFTIVKW